MVFAAVQAVADAHTIRISPGFEADFAAQATAAKSVHDALLDRFADAGERREIECSWKDLLVFG